MYTERYMGLPTPEDNLSGYQAGDVTLLAERLRGKQFYVMHGNADDNVHYQNAAKLFTKLQQLNIPFDQMVSIILDIIKKNWVILELIFVVNPRTSAKYNAFSGFRIVKKNDL